MATARERPSRVRRRLCASACQFQLTPFRRIGLTPKQRRSHFSRHRFRAFRSRDARDEEYFHRRRGRLALAPPPRCKSAPKAKRRQMFYFYLLQASRAYASADYRVITEDTLISPSVEQIFAAFDTLTATRQLLLFDFPIDIHNAASASEICRRVATTGDEEEQQPRCARKRRYHRRFHRRETFLSRIPRVAGLRARRRRLIFPSLRSRFKIASFIRQAPTSTRREICRFGAPYARIDASARSIF